MSSVFPTFSLFIPSHSKCIAYGAHTRHFHFSNYDGGGSVCVCVCAYSGEYGMAYTWKSEESFAMFVLLPLLGGSGDRTLAVRVAQQSPLPVAPHPRPNLF